MLDCLEPHPLRWVSMIDTGSTTETTKQKLIRVARDGQALPRPTHAECEMAGANSACAGAGISLSKIGI
jgi:hypothetical protein